MSTLWGSPSSAALRHLMVWASRRGSLKRLITAAPLTRNLVHRFVAGEDIESAVRVARELALRHLEVSLDRLGEDTHDADDAAATVSDYKALIGRLAVEGLAANTEVSLKLSAVGQAWDEGLALDHASAVCEAARAAGTSVTVDMEDHTTTDATLRCVARLRADYPNTGAVIQASLRRSLHDCAALAHPGSRVRLCKGAYQEPPDVAWQGRTEVRIAFVRCLRILLDGGAYPMLATHDPQLINACGRLLDSRRRNGAAHEFQMLYGIRPDEQLRLVRAGERVRIYTPFGTQWYAYLMRRMAERPANLALVLRALASSN